MSLRIGCGPGVESRAVAELLRRRLASFGATTPVAHPQRASLLKALVNDRLDLVPEYAASLLAALNSMMDLETNLRRTVRTLRKELEPFGVLVSEPTAGRDVPALVLRADRAAALGIASLDSLRRNASGLRASGSLGVTRQTWHSFGLPPRQPFASYVDDGHGGAARLLAPNLPRVDVVLTYSSDPDLAGDGYLVVEPMPRRTPADHLVTLVRQDRADILDVVNPEMAKLTTAGLIALNRRLSASTAP